MFRCKRSSVYPAKGHYIDVDGTARQTEVTRLQAQYIEQIQRLERAIHEAGVKEFPIGAQVKWITGFEGQEAIAAFGRGRVSAHGTNRYATVTSATGADLSLRFEDLYPDLEARGANAPVTQATQSEAEGPGNTGHKS